MPFERATIHGCFARVGIAGPSGSGKSLTSLYIMRGLVGEKGRIAAICSERGSIRKYSDVTPFDVLVLDRFAPTDYVEAMREAVKAKYDGLIIDGVSQAWAGKGGALEMVSAAASRSRSQNSYFAWREVTPHHNRMVDAMTQIPMHLVATMRSKTEYVIENVDGKQVPRKVGMQPIQRAGLEYEFDIMGDMELDHSMIISKARCRPLQDKIISLPNVSLGETLAEWLDGAIATETAEDFERAMSGKIEVKAKSSRRRSTPEPPDASQVIDLDQADIVERLLEEKGVTWDSMRAAIDDLPEAVGDLTLAQYASVCANLGAK